MTPPLRLDALYNLDQYIDGRALGFSARVARATHWASGQDVAFKVLRCEHQTDERVWQQFATEIDLLTQLRPTGIPADLIDCGYVSDRSRDCPTGGEIVSHGQDGRAFRADLADRFAKNWRPYLGLELLPGERCLLNLIHGADGDGRRPLRLPTEEALSLIIQFAHFLQLAHSADLVYWDHKPEHVYWIDRRLRIIDLNVSRAFGPATGNDRLATDKGRDLQYMLTGVAYTALTGRDFRFTDQAPQPSPSAPKMVEMRFNGVSQLDFSVDETLFPTIVTTINQLLAAPPGSLTAAALLDQAYQLAAQLGRETPGYPASETSQAARAELLKGLAALQQAQAAITQARQHFLQAHALHPEDKESERLFHEASEFYRARVLP
jgi:serine/threonine protein kinase